MTEPTPNIRFPILDSEPRKEVAGKLAQLALKVSKLTDDFAHIDRIPRLSSSRLENDAEHSYMLSVAAPELAHMLGLKLDIDKVRRFAIVHDLLEIKVGDANTFDLSPQELEEKELREKAVLDEFKNELPAETAKDLEDYERQDTSEAVFVRMVDKLLPLAVDYTGDGVRVLREDFGIETVEELIESHDKLHSRIAEKFGDTFPDLVAAHAILCEIVEQKFADGIEDAHTVEKERNPDEVEVKYLVDLNDLPNDIDLETVRSKYLTQGYVAIGADGSETRIRDTDHQKFELTIKSPGMIKRAERTIPITKELFEGLWLQTEGRQVFKRRFYIPHGDLMIELDIYEGDLAGLVTAEVEFDGRPTEAMIRAATFQKNPPKWFGENVSHLLRYKNHMLAQQPQHKVFELGSKNA